jgi:hypothetical protein
VEFPPRFLILESSGCHTHPTDRRDAGVDPARERASPTEAGSEGSTSASLSTPAHEFCIEAQAPAAEQAMARLSTTAASVRAGAS